MVGCLLGLMALMTGGGARRRSGVLEFWGGAVTWALMRWLPSGRVAAMTLGHSVLGLNERSLDACRTHELVHVRQYERWGLLFVPAYLLCSLVLWMARRDCYLDNPFEIEARRCCRSRRLP